jgi:hypothetical protein
MYNATTTTAAATPTTTTTAAPTTSAPSVAVRAQAAHTIPPHVGHADFENARKGRRPGRCSRRRPSRPGRPRAPNQALVGHPCSIQSPPVIVV